MYNQLRILTQINTNIVATVQDSHSEFSFTDKSLGKNVMTSFGRIDNENKDILILGEGTTQGFDHSALTEETKYLINFTQIGKRLLSSLDCNGSNIFLFVNATKIYQFKAKDSEIKDYTLC